MTEVDYDLFQNELSEETTEIICQFLQECPALLDTQVETWCAKYPDIAGEIRLTAEILLDNMDPDVDEEDPEFAVMAERVFRGGLAKMGIRPEDTLPGPAA